MPAALDHTIVHVRSKAESAAFFVEMLGLAPARESGIFTVVRLANGVSLDFIETDQKFDLQHYAFHVSEREFDEIFGRIKARGLPYWADPMKQKPGETYAHEGGRGVYFDDPSGHFLEILTWRAGG